MKIIMKATKGCGQLSSNDTFFSDIWFSGVKKAEKAMDEGVDHFGHVKTTHKIFCLAKLEKLMKECPGGYHIVMKITPRVPGDGSLMAIGYNYRSKNVLGFIATEGRGGGDCTRCSLFIPLH